MTRLMPQQPVPPLTVPTTAGTLWTLADRQPGRHTLITFYRGLHCPLCARQLAELQQLLPTFDALGVDVIAISSDGPERAATARREWQLETLPVGHSLSEESARAWGLYVSDAIPYPADALQEPSRFSEPGLFLVQPDGTLYFGAVQTMPFARPPMREVLRAVEYVLTKAYPARGGA